MTEKSKPQIPKKITKDYLHDLYFYFHGIEDPAGMFLSQYCEFLMEDNIRLLQSIAECNCSGKSKYDQQRPVGNSNEKKEADNGGNRMDRAGS